jgi:hypothetical protein
LAARQPVLRLTPESTVRDTAAAARAMGLQVQVLNADTSREIDAAFGDVLTTVEQPEMSKWTVILLLVHGPFFEFN